MSRNIYRIFYNNIRNGVFMYYVPEGTKRCGYYECALCGEKFLTLDTTEYTECIYCANDIDMEMGPDDDMSDVGTSAKLIQILEGEDVEKLDALLSLAITGGNYDWI
jgi:hypothetical protein